MFVQIASGEEKLVRNIRTVDPSNENVVLDERENRTNEHVNHVWGVWWNIDHIFLRHIYVFSFSLHFSIENSQFSLV